MAKERKRTVKKIEAYRYGIFFIVFFIFSHCC
jgi:hypothetical protein